MHTLFGKRIRTHLLPIVMACALTACGAKDSHDGPAVFTGSIVISPASLSLAVGDDPTDPFPPCPGSPPTMAIGPIFPFLITVLDADGKPVGNADLDITVDFAGNTSFPPPSLGGVIATVLIDGDSGAIVSDEGKPVAYETKTDEFGNKEMLISFLAVPDCEYAGSMTVTSASLFAQMQFDVSL